jgi:putative transposase
LALSQVSLPAHTEKEVIVARKIRVYPKNEDKWFAVMNNFRRDYNLAIEKMKEMWKPSSGFKWFIRDSSSMYPDYISVVAEEAYRLAEKTRKAVIAKRVKGEKCDYSFKKKNAVKQSFICQKLSKNGVFPSKLKAVYAEEFPQEAIGKQAIVSYENGRWFVSVQIKVKLADYLSKNLRVVALDPGVRKFISYYSADESGIMGSGLQEKLSFLQDKLDHLLSRRSKLKKNDAGLRRHLNKRINNLRWRMKNVVTDMQYRISDYLVKNFDLILLPTFRTKDMVAREGRKIRKKSVRNMLDMRHFSFQQILVWMSRKHGKHVVLVNEAYTSKTMPDGSIREINGAETIVFGDKKIDRDIHGARNILIRYLTKSGAYPFNGPTNAAVVFVAL